MDNFNLKKFLVENRLTTNSLILSEEKGAPVSKTKKASYKLASGADMGERPAPAMGMIGTVNLDGQDYEVKAFQGRHSPVYTLIGHESFSENMGMPGWKYFMEKLQGLNGGEEVVFTPAEDVMMPGVAEGSYEDEEGSGYSNAEYKEGPGAKEEDIQKVIAHFKKNPLVWKMVTKKDFESMAKGEGDPNAKEDYYPEWKKEDFVKVLQALESI
jgi:hypothetical protein